MHTQLILFHFISFHLYILHIGHHIPEIRARAICNIQSKFQSCRTDLEDLIVNINDLTKRLVKWFDFKPVSHVNQVFEILLSLLKVNNSANY